MEMWMILCQFILYGTQWSQTDLDIAWPYGPTSASVYVCVIPGFEFQLSD